MKKTRRLATVAVLTALALIINVAEGALPPLLVPGARLGLSNLIPLFALFALGPLDALAIAAAKTLLSAIFSGASTLLFSLPAGLAAVLVSILLAKYLFPKISVTAVSVCSAVLHNVTQNLIFCLISGSSEMLIYTPYLALAGVLAGALVGLAAGLLLRRVKIPGGS
jgi:heptaprenyl diphosphate synthase